MVVLGSNHITQDADIVCVRDPENIAALAAAPGVDLFAGPWARGLC